MYSFMSKHYNNNNIDNVIIIYKTTNFQNICGYLSKHKYTENFHIMK